MIKVAIKYEIFPSIEDLNTFIRGFSDCHYSPNPNRLYFKTGTWEIPKGPLYADDIAIKPSPKTISGLGVFKDVNQEVPDFIFSHDWQTVFVCDYTLIKIASKYLGEKIMFLEIPYKQAFEGVFDFESSLTMSKKETE